ncbi:hypothetical protein GCM10017673_15010 [Streptosporangium violaceochromogenes]|nr:hypothetical protein GCM10017673_15010 [Streptosporangium violaceochromogenes]
MVAQPSVRAVSTGEASGSSLTVSKPAGTVQGDILLAFQSDDDGVLSDMATPTGGATWQLLASRSDTGTIGTLTKVWWKVAGSSEPSTYGFTFRAGTISGVVTVVAVRDGAAATPVVAQVSSGTGTTVNTPGLTPPDSASLEVRYAAVADDESATLSVPATYTGLSAPAQVGYIACKAAAKQLPSGAATGTLAFTSTTTPYTRHGFSVAIGTGAIDASVTPTTVTAGVSVPVPVVAFGAGPNPTMVPVPVSVPVPVVAFGAGPNPTMVPVPVSVPAPVVTVGDTEVVTPTTVPVPVSVPAPVVSAGAGTQPGAVGVGVAVYLPDVQVTAAAVPATVRPSVAVGGAAATVPVLPGDQLDGSPGQIEFNGFTLGRGTPYRWLTLDGWRGKETPDSGNAPRASRAGSAPGRPLPRERTVLWTAGLKASREEIEAAVLALENATPLLGTAAQWPLVINDLGTPYLAFGRIDRVNIPVDRLLRVGAGRVVMQWILADPRRYAINATGVTIPVNTTVTVTNAGNTETHPILIVPGPAVTPKLHNLTTGRITEWNLTVPDGQDLVINTDLGTAKLNGVDVIGDMSSGSVAVPDWTLARGPQDIRYTTASGGSQAEVLYRDAWN